MGGVLCRGSFRRGGGGGPRRGGGSRGEASRWWGGLGVWPYPRGRGEGGGWRSGGRGGGGMAGRGEGATEGWIAELRELMWKDAGLLRDRVGLERARRGLDALAMTMPRGMFRRAVEARNLHLIAGVMVASARGREESRG